MATMGDLCLLAETAQTAGMLFASRLVLDAVFEKDMGAIEKIVKRIDGEAPDKAGYSTAANYMAGALTDVLSMTRDDQIRIMPDDPPIVALAKTVFFLSVSTPGKDSQARKNKNAAIDMILTRCGGKITEPVRKRVETAFEAPAWMERLNSGNDSVTQ